MKESELRKYSLLAEVALLLLILCFAAGCGKTGAENNRTSMGVDDEIAGFLFNFDQRAETVRMVKNKRQGRLPVRVSWYYEGNQSARVTEEDIEKNAQASDDTEMISDVFYALSNTIVLGIATNQTNTFAQYFIEFELEGGETVRYNFVTENTVRLGDQNYVVETDGSLWTTF